MEVTTPRSCCQSPSTGGRLLASDHRLSPAADTGSLLPGCCGALRSAGAGSAFPFSVRPGWRKAGAKGRPTTSGELTCTRHLTSARWGSFLTRMEKPTLCSSPSSSTENDFAVRGGELRPDIPWPVVPQSLPGQSDKSKQQLQTAELRKNNCFGLQGWHQD